jgi:endonuclease/exonuclease/phosphatase family metal-dependent hydrolase
LRKFVKKFLWIVNFIFAVILVIANLSVYVSPEVLWPLAFLGLVFIHLLVLNLAFLVFWILKVKKYFFISLVALAISIPNLSHTFQISGPEKDKQKSQESVKSIKVMTYNAKVFDLVGSNRFDTTQRKVFNYIKEKEPDIVCLQEFYINPDKGFSLEILNELLPNYLKYRNVHWLSETGNSKYGIAIFSKFPVVNKGLIKFENSYNAFLFADLKHNRDTFRIYNNHLQSIKFNRDNYRFIANQSRYNQKEKIEELQDISFRMRDAYIKRSLQAEQLAEHIKICPYPVIVCGDLNDTPVSYSYRIIKGHLDDAFVEAGEGFGNTYAGKFPSYRIDYIFHSDFFKARKFEVPKIELSDHYPVLVKLAYD